MGPNDQFNKTSYEINGENVMKHSDTQKSMYSSKFGGSQQTIKSKSSKAETGGGRSK